MTFPIFLTFGFLAIAGFLRITNRLRSDLAALVLLMALGLAQLLPFDDLFSGFSRSAVVLIIAIYMIAAGLENTGALRMISRAGLRYATGGGRRAILGISALAAGLSLGLNTVVVVALLLPGTLALARQNRVSPGRLLLPLAFGALLGGMATLFTTANILVSAALVDQGYAALTVVDYLPGALVAIAGILFLTLFGPTLLPTTPRTTTPDPDSPLTELYAVPDQVRALYVKPGSSLANVSLADGGWNRSLGLTVVGLSRGSVIRMAPPRDEVVRVGDVVFVIGAFDQNTLDQYGLFPTEDPDWPGHLASSTTSLVEVVPAPRSSALGKTLREIQFREKYAMNALALWREGATERDRLADRALQLGDALLLQGRRDRIAALRRDPDFIVLDEDAEEPAIGWRAWAAITLALAALILPALNLLPIAEAAFVAAALMILLGCMPIEHAYRAVDWKTVFTIAAILPISLTLTHTGAADWVAGLTAATVGTIGPWGTAVFFCLAAVALTQLFGGRVTAIVVAPVAITAATRLGLDPRMLAIVVAWGCSTAFLSPRAHAANQLVTGPGGYTSRDFLRIGLPLTGVVLAAILLVLARP